MQGVLLGGRYRILEVLRAGGFGQTYIAEDMQRPGNPQCLVKQLKPGRNDEAFMQVTRRLFNTEAEILEKLGQHDQIPLLLAYFEENQEFYLVQEFIVGQTLSEELSHEKRFSEAKIVAMLRDALGILEFVHSQQVIHRDIKPQNLMHRQQDGKLVLIDFGAVKEIGNQLAGEVDETGMTVAVGTRGYMPGEQLVGKPRFSSDIYALGMTAIQALTGIRPAKFPDDPYTSEIIWRDKVQVSERLGSILDKMVRYDFRDRYQSATEVLQDLQPPKQNQSVTFSLQLPRQLANRTSILKLGQQPQFRQLQQQARKAWRQGLKTGVLSTAQSYIKDFKRQSRRRNWKQNLRWVWRTMAAGPVMVLLTTLAVTGLVQGIQFTGKLQPLELALFDWMLRRQSSEEADPRLLVVAIAETDLEQYPWPLSKETVAQLLQKLQQYKPHAIGLDLDLTQLQETGQAALVEQLKNNNVIMTRDIEKTQDNKALPVRSRERTSFSNVPIDPDGIVRRTWLFTNPGEGIIYSLPFSVALTYLSKFPEYTIIEGIPGYTANEDEPDFTKIESISAESNQINPDFVQMGTAFFKPLKATSGGYQTLDVQGYQSLLNYRSADPVAKEVTLTQILTSQFDPDWVKGKAVLIGPTAPEIGDRFLTPYQVVGGQPLELSQTVLHTHMLSQILSGALDARPLFQIWTGSREFWWMMGWGVAGGFLAWFSHRHYLVFALGGVTMLGTLSYFYVSNFGQQKWIPLVTPAIVLTATTAVVSTWRFVQVRQLHQKSQNNQTTPAAIEEEDSDCPTGIESPATPGFVAAQTPQATQVTGLDYLAAIDNSHSAAKMTGFEELSGYANPSMASGHSATAEQSIAQSVPRQSALEAPASRTRGKTEAPTTLDNLIDSDVADPDSLTVADLSPRRSDADPPTMLDAAPPAQAARSEEATALESLASRGDADPPTMLDAAPSAQAARSEEATALELPAGQGNADPPTVLDVPLPIQEDRSDPPTIVEYPDAMDKPSSDAETASISQPVRQRVNLQPGSASMIVRGRLNPHQRQYYLVRGKQEQLLSVQVLSGAINLVVFDPENQAMGKILPLQRDNVAKDSNRWQSWLPDAGDYSIGVTAPEVTNYTLSLELSDEESTLRDDTISMSSSSGARAKSNRASRMRTKLTANEVKQYKFDCRQGQRLTVQVLEGEVHLSAIAPDGRKIQAKVGGAKQWRSSLPATGKYIVEIVALSPSAIRLYVV